MTHKGVGVTMRHVWTVQLVQVFGRYLPVPGWSRKKRRGPAIGCGRNGLKWKTLLLRPRRKPPARSFSLPRPPKRPPLFSLASGGACDLLNTIEIRRTFDPPSEIPVFPLVSPTFTKTESPPNPPRGSPYGVSTRKPSAPRGHGTRANDQRPVPDFVRRKRKHLPLAASRICRRPRGKQRFSIRPIIRKRN